MEKKPLPIAEDEPDRKLLSDIARVGWHLVAVQEDDDGPPYVFSVGLYHSFDQPEIMIIGLDQETAGRLVNNVGKLMQAGSDFHAKHVNNEIADGFPMGFRAVEKEYYGEYLGYALWFYESFEFPVLQMLWPDKQSRFPWNDNCEETCRSVQRLEIIAGRQ